MKKKLSWLDRVAGLTAHLRSPEGCPWDRKQTHISLIPYLREETKELEHAFRRGRWHEIEDELGDVLLQVLLNAEIEREKGNFTIQDVAKGLCLKLKRRHPHVFGKGKLHTAEEVWANWKTIKGAERRLRRKDVLRRKKR